MRKFGYDDIAVTQAWGTSLHTLLPVLASPGTPWPSLSPRLPTTTPWTWNSASRPARAPWSASARARGGARWHSAIISLPRRVPLPAGQRLLQPGLTCFTSPSSLIRSSTRRTVWWGLAARKKACLHGTLYGARGLPVVDTWGLLHLQRRPKRVRDHDLLVKLVPHSMLTLAACECGAVGVIAAPLAFAPACPA